MRGWPSVNEDGIYEVGGRAGDGRVNVNNFSLAAWNRQWDELNLAVLCESRRHKIRVNATLEEGIECAVYTDLIRRDLRELEPHLSVVGDAVDVKTQVNALDGRCRGNRDLSHACGRGRAGRVKLNLRHRRRLSHTGGLPPLWGARVTPATLNLLRSCSFPLLLSTLF